MKTNINSADAPQSADKKTARTECVALPWLPPETSIITVLVMLLLLLAALPAQAQFKRIALTNFALPYPGAPAITYTNNGTNSGYLVFSGPTITNATIWNTPLQTNGVNGAGASTYYIGKDFLPGVPVTFNFAVYMPAAETTNGNVTAYLGFSPDGFFWFTNALQLTIPCTGGVTNYYSVSYSSPASFETNAAYIAWDGLTSTNLYPVTVENIGWQVIHPTY
jgi:hypothetical protein